MHGDQGSHTRVDTNFGFRFPTQAISKDSGEDHEDEAAKRHDKKRKSDERVRTDCSQQYTRPAQAAAATFRPSICCRPTQTYSRQPAGADALSLMLHSGRAVSTAMARATVRRRRGSYGPWRCTSSLSTPSIRWVSTVSLGPCNGLGCPQVRSLLTSVFAATQWLGLQTC